MEKSYDSQPNHWFDSGDNNLKIFVRQRKKWIRTAKAAMEKSQSKNLTPILFSAEAEAEAEAGHRPRESHARVASITPPPRNPNPNTPPASASPKPSNKVLSLSLSPNWWMNLMVLLIQSPRNQIVVLLVLLQHLHAHLMLIFSVLTGKGCVFMEYFVVNLMIISFRVFNFSSYILRDHLKLYICFYA